MPHELTPPLNNGHDDLRDVAYLPHHVRGLQTEMAAVVNECLQELDKVGELLLTLETPAGTSAADPRDGRNSPDADRDAHAASVIAASQPPTTAAAFGDTGQPSDFDARLANLKRMLAEKLTEG